MARKKINIQGNLEIDGITLNTSIIMAVRNGRIADIVNAIGTAELHKAGFPITLEEGIVLFLLFYYGGLTQRTIAETLEKDNPSITRLIDTLEHQEMLERRNDPTDRRANKVYLTKHGKEIVPQITEITKNSFRLVFKGITTDDFVSLHRIISQIIENEKKYTEENRFY